MLLSLNYSEYPLEKPGEVSTSQCVAFGEGYDSFGGLPRTKGCGAEDSEYRSSVTSFLSPCSPTSYWKSLAPDRSDEEHDPVDSTSRPRHSHSYPSDSDTEAKPTETDA